MLALVLISACAGNPQAAGTPCAGFLGDYTGFQVEDSRTGTRLQVRDGYDLAKYWKVVISPVAIYAPEKMGTGKLTQSDFSTLSFELDQALRRHLRMDYEVVDETAADVLRIRIALTRTEDKHNGLTVFEGNASPGNRSEAVPPLSPAARELLALARCEYEVLDSKSGERLVALLKEPGRKGGDDPVGASRAGIRIECDRLAEALRFQLQTLREGPPSPPPIRRTFEPHQRFGDEGEEILKIKDPLQ